MALPDKCPLCSASRELQSVVTPHVYGGGGGRAFFHCNVCDVRYQYPGLTPEEEARFYATEFEKYMAGRTGNKGGWDKAEDHIRVNETNRLRRMKYLEPRLGKGTTILEVGCSSGFMLYPLVDAGYVCSGIEPSGIFREYIKGRGLPVYETLDQLQKLQKLGPERRFDFIMHFLCSSIFLNRKNSLILSLLYLSRVAR